MYDGMVFASFKLSTNTIKMRKTILAIVLTIITTCFAFAAEKHTFILVKQLTMANRSQLPDKTVEYDLQQLDFNAKKGDPLLIGQISMLIDSISNEDINNSYYTLSLTDQGSGTVSVTIESLQELPVGIKNDVFYGMIGNCVVLRDNSTEALLKRVFTRSKGKAELIQEYEIVEVIIKRCPALLNATITGNNVRIDTFDVNGNDDTPASFDE